MIPIFLIGWMPLVIMSGMCFGSWVSERIGDSGAQCLMFWWFLIGCLLYVYGVGVCLNVGFGPTVLMPPGGP